MTMPIFDQALISVSALAQAMAGPVEQRPVVLDASFDLNDPAAGARAWTEERIPGSIHVHLDLVLSDAKTGQNGRHPLPAPEVFAQRLGALGLDGLRPVVVLDRNGSMFAARLWWMLRWVGHTRVAVLDGGWPAWKAAGQATENGPAAPVTHPSAFPVRSTAVQRVDYRALRTALDTAPPVIVDARSADRFRGENETLDPVAGHIPGARNRFFKDNLRPDGRFKPADVLRDEWSAVLAGADPAQVVHQCGSGVTACHNLLALAHAGLPDGVLYPGSWSEWCAQPDALIS
jgi:thiosulfate/3-mercaptopyruvate sulfurtransferase